MDDNNRNCYKEYLNTISTYSDPITEYQKGLIATILYTGDLVQFKISIDSIESPFYKYVNRTLCEITGGPNDWNHFFADELHDDVCCPFVHSYDVSTFPNVQYLLSIENFINDTYAPVIDTDAPVIDIDPETKFYRGCGLPSKVVNGYKPGKEFFAPTIFSSSTNEQVSIGFRNQATIDNAHGVLFVIKDPMCVGKAIKFSFVYGEEERFFFVPSF